MTTRTVLPALFAAALCLGACKKGNDAPASAPSPEASRATPRGHQVRVGLVTDVGGRGDGSFNDSALRGLELWAAGQRYSGTGYVPASPEERQASIPEDLAQRPGGFEPVQVLPLVLQSKAQEDYEPNLQLLVDRGTELSIGVGFMLENAVEAAARANPQARFLLIDSPLLDAAGKPIRLPNVRTVVFREEEGSFLVGALAGLVTKTGKVAFVGGMEIPLIKKFEAGFRAGVATTNPQAAAALRASYTGSFDKVAAGKQVAQDLLAKGTDVLFHGAGSDGLGVIQAVKEARAQGKQVFVIGVDSDQSSLAPEAVLTSMVKRVDLAVYEAARDVATQSFTAEDRSLGLAERGITYAPVRVEFPGKAEALAKLEALRERVAKGELQVPATLEALTAFKAQP